MLDIKDRLQWYIITVIGGQEDTIVNALREKMNNYGYKSKVQDFKIFWQKKQTIDVFNKNSPNIPSKLKQTKSISWTVLPDGRYQRTRTRIINRFPGYIFVNCDLDSDVWYAIRNTVGVLGFVGSTGKNTKPIPCSIDEYEKLLTESATTEYANKISNENDNKEDNVHKSPTIVKKDVPKKNTIVNPFKIGQNVVIIKGSFEGTTGCISAIDETKQMLKINVEFFNRINSFDVAFDDVKLKDN